MRTLLIVLLFGLFAVGFVACDGGGGEGEEEREEIPISPELPEPSPEPWSFVVPEQLTDAAKSVVEDMNLVLVSAEATGLDGQVIARTARKKTVTINITRQAKNVSHIKIQVGKLGDQATSLLILERIKDRL